MGTKAPHISLQRPTNCRPPANSCRRLLPNICWLDSGPIVYHKWRRINRTGTSLSVHTLAKNCRHQNPRLIQKFARRENFGAKKKQRFDKRSTVGKPRSCAAKRGQRLRQVIQVLQRCDHIPLPPFRLACLLGNERTSA